MALLSPPQERIAYTACPLCGSPRFDHVVTADWSPHPLRAHIRGRLSPRLHWMQCGACDHVFTDGYFRPEALSVLFESANAHQVLDRNFEAARMVSSRMVEKMLPYADGGTWLDIGMGNGALLMTASEYGFKPIGCDLRMASVEAVRAIGIEAHCKDIADLELPAPCSVLSMADVLEHIPFPKTGLQEARRLLAEGGMLFVSMPNRESPAWDALDAMNANPYWLEVEHYHNFARSRLYSLLRENGFEPLRYGVSERYRVCMEVIARKL